MFVLEVWRCLLFLTDGLCKRLFKCVLKQCWCPSTQKVNCWIFEIPFLRQIINSRQVKGINSCKANIFTAMKVWVKDWRTKGIHPELYLVNSYIYYGIYGGSVLCCRYECEYRWLFGSVLALLQTSNMSTVSWDGLQRHHCPELDKLKRIDGIMEKVDWPELCAWDNHINDIHSFWRHMEPRIENLKQSSLNSKRYSHKEYVSIPWLHYPPRYARVVFKDITGAFFYLCDFLKMLNFYVANQGQWSYQILFRVNIKI